ncbi:pyrroline-5-carboxylate reductase [Oecophyllibacter saccharovorans]|uniref:Pyrroline-5-carboxylate reductase n=1 Tax=Oecophyllibacter saccharovorans TaxID=2558360 RepID=A0A506UL22_9PROT|nr:pyrroline-5-carboxylate reductase [Oecophyllibacter saccharovorans]TPW33760.1 pyrroline-5-carboxylate reductase [Oecophyllibacter saccharovorans]TPW34036.1 pyrroline-5-carboxylate reductase [Oecophyllibacter saccharovorans]
MTAPHPASAPSSSDAPVILLAGCGRMGSALAQGWAASAHPPRLVILDHKLEKAPGNAPIYRQVKDLPADLAPALIVLAVKPAGAAELLEALRQHLGKGLTHSTLLSIMAGKSCADLARACGNPDMAVIRAIPNTPSSVNAGTTGLYAGPTVSAPMKALAHQLMSDVGAVVEVPKEEDLRAVTALSGSGPAYVFLLAELLEKSGVELGLSRETATQLARNMIYGAGKMLHDLPQSAATLRQNVTSPNGTTAAALDVLSAPDAWPRTVPQATRAAAKRAAELDD